MSKNLIIADKAESDIETIFDYIAERNKKAAEKTVKQFYKLFERICDYPNLGKSREDFTFKNVKFITLDKKYVVIYNVEAETLYILRGLTAYQELCTLF